MIIGKLKDLQRYKGLTENIDIAIDYVLNNDLLSLEKGTYVIKEGAVKLIRDTYIARPLEECYFESHEKFLDLQIVLKGQEGFGYCDASEMGITVTAPYNPEKDVCKYSIEKYDLNILRDGAFALVFPEDLHMPKYDIDGKTVEKAVIKIKL